MNNSTEKLEMLRAEIEKDSQKQADNLVNEAKKSSGEKIKEKKEQLKARYDSELLRVTEDFRSAEKKRVSAVRFSEGRRVLVCRAELTEKFFGEIEEELQKAAASPDYIKFLKRCAERANEFSPLDAAVTAYCRPEDGAAAREALSAYGTAIEETREIRLGGLMFRYKDKSALTDLTIDTALEQERRDFSSKKEMQIN